MHRSEALLLPVFRQLSCKPVLILCWITGLLLGMFTAAGAGDSLLLMMRGGAFSAVSIPGQLLVILFPFLFTALAVSLSLPWLLRLVVFFKAFAFGFCSCAVTLAFGEASWLVRLLLMFSDGCSLPLLMLLWLRCCDRHEKHCVGSLAAFTAAAAFWGILDICIVSPFAVTLL